jgi:hypothetical protein
MHLVPDGIGGRADYEIADYVEDQNVVQTPAIQTQGS